MTFNVVAYILMLILMKINLEKIGPNFIVLKISLNSNVPLIPLQT